MRGFVGLTDKQFEVLQAGERLTLFIVCNLADPEAIEIVEIPSERLRSAEPKVECTYYWYRTQHRFDARLRVAGPASGDWRPEAGTTGASGARRTNAQPF